eukprot:gene12758-21057_t
MRSLRSPFQRRRTMLMALAAAALVRCSANTLDAANPNCTDNSEGATVMCRASGSVHVAATAAAIFFAPTTEWYTHSSKEQLAAGPTDHGKVAEARRRRLGLWADLRLEPYVRQPTASQMCGALYTTIPSFCQHLTASASTAAKHQCPQTCATCEVAATLGGGTICNTCDCTANAIVCRNLPLETLPPLAKGATDFTTTFMLTGGVGKWVIVPGEGYDEACAEYQELIKRQGFDWLWNGGLPGDCNRRAIDANGDVKLEFGDRVPSTFPGLINRLVNRKEWRTHDEICDRPMRTPLTGTMLPQGNGLIDFGDNVPGFFDTYW